MVPAEAVRAARARIGRRVHRTPLRESVALTARAGHPVLLKLEHHQTTGSFKLRGATNALMALTAGPAPAGRRRRLDRQSRPRTRPCRPGARHAAR
jgi:threonine dehydratase